MCQNNYIFKKNIQLKFGVKIQTLTDVLTYQLIKRRNNHNRKI